MTSPAIIPITAVTDPRIAAYVALKEREIARKGDRFIAEGHFVVQRLLNSDYPVESVFLDEKRVEAVAPIVPAGIPIYTAPSPVMRDILGFKFHSGVIACGRRKPSATLEEIASAPSATIVVCPDLANAENLGGIVRLAAGFGAAGLVLGPRSVDPFWRQAIRVSMGTIFSLPVVRSDDLVADLRRLHDEFDVETYATILDPAAESLATVRPAGKSALVFGGEGYGLERPVIEACKRRITIPMQMGTDSLNVAVAAGIFLFYFTQARKREPRDI